MRLPWNSAGTTGFGQGGWGQTQTQQPPANQGAQWGQGWGQTSQNSTGSQNWAQQGNQGWNQNSGQSNPNPNQGWGQQDQGGGNNSNWASDGWSAGGNTNAGNNSGWNSSPPPSSGGGGGGSGRSYTIGRGDTLTSIASRNGTSVRRLMQLNNLSDPHRIQVGQRIALP